MRRTTALPSFENSLLFCRRGDVTKRTFYNRYLKSSLYALCCYYAGGAARRSVHPINELKCCLLLEKLPLCTLLLFCRRRCVTQRTVSVVLPLLFLVLLCFCIILQEEGRDEAYSQKGWYYLFDADDRSHHHPDVSSARTVDATHM